VTTVLAIDAGTTGVRTLALDRTGAVTDLAYRELTQHFPRPSWVEHDANEIWDAVRETLLEVAGRLAESGGTVAAIGITNQRETTLAFDRHTGAPLHHAIVWQDRRTADRCEELTAAGHLPTVRARTGLVLDSYFSATKMEWLLRHTDAAATGGDLALATVDTWVLWQLTGGPRSGAYVTDVTNASRTLLFDINELGWSDELCGLFGIERRWLADVVPSCGRVGIVDTDALGASGDAARVLLDVPVSGIAGDQQAALFGQACFAAGTAKVTYGTGSFVLLNCGDSPPPPVDGLVTTVAWDLGAHGGPSGAVAYALEGSAFVSGAAVQWLRDGLGLIERASDLGPLAESVPDSGGVVIVPAFTGLGSPWWDPHARGIVTGLTRGAGRAQIARAVVEAMAFQVRDMLDAMRAASPYELTLLRADGGASAMDLLLQLQADQIGVPVGRPTSVESTARGAATLAGMAEGVWGSLDDLAAHWELDRECTPELDPVLADALHQVWLRSVDRARAWATA
jgi:glycerol kinase